MNSIIKTDKYISDNSSHACCKVNIFNKIVLFVTVLISVTPILNQQFSKIIWSILIALWYIVVACERRNQRFHYFSFSCLILIWILWEITLKVFGFSSASIGNYFLLITFFDMIIKSLYVQQYYSNKEKRILLRLIQIIIAVNIISNIYVGYIYSNIHYYVYFYPEQYLNLNVAQTEFYNMLAFFIGANFFLVQKEKNKICKVFDVFLIILSYYFILNFETRTTSLIMSFILILLIIINRNPSKLRKILKTILFITFFSSIFLIEFDFIIRYLPERVAVRISAVINHDTFINSEYTSRVGLFFNGVRTMFSSLPNFIFGVGNHLGSDYSSIIGQHSLISDYMAKYGLLGLLFLLYFFSSIKKVFCNLKTNHFVSEYNKIVIFVFIIISFLSNSFRSETAVVVFLILSAINESAQQTNVNVEVK